MENKGIRGSKGSANSLLASMVVWLCPAPASAVCPTFLLICLLTFFLGEQPYVLCVCMSVWVQGLSASDWAGTQLGSCTTVTGETRESEIKCQWSETRAQRPMSVKPRPHKQLVRGSLGARQLCACMHVCEMCIYIYTYMYTSGIYTCSLCVLTGNTCTASPWGHAAVSALHPSGYQVWSDSSNTPVSS